MPVRKMENKSDESLKVFLRKKLKIKKLKNQEIKIRKNYQKNEKDKITFYPIWKHFAMVVSVEIENFS